MDLRPRLPDSLNIALLAGVYVVAARVGLMFEPVGGFASLVWAPSGIALVALVLHGAHLWPGVLLGAAVANAVVGAPLPVAVAIGIGNTAGALAAAVALRRLDFDVELHDTRSAVRLVAVSMASAAIPATVGAAVLLGAGAVPESSGWLLWRAWWIGDTIGNLLVAPVVLVWNTRRAHPVHIGRRLEFLLALVVNVAIASFIFSPPENGTSPPNAYLLFPTLIWAAVRFGARGAVTAVTLVAAVAIFGTTSSRGPFARPDLQQGLLGLQMFVGVSAATFLVLGATIAERRRVAQEAQRARDEAEEANRAKAEFLGVMSHELRTPLNAISGFVDLLLLGAQGTLTGQQRHAVERIQRNQSHLLTLINDLLAFTGLEAGKVKLDVRPVSVKAVLDDVEPLIQPELARKQLTFTREPMDAGLVVRADADKLAQILVNLLTNAAKYTEAGGSVFVGAMRRDGSADITVRDSGIGIPPDQLEAVFQPFFQVERGRTRKYPGVGLGLTIARDLARIMGGDIRVQSELGHGTMVTVTLPLA